MALTVPTAGTEINVANFGKPVVDEVNRLTVATTPGAWVQMTFAPDWTNYGGFTACQYRRAGTRVELRLVAQRKLYTVPSQQTITIATGLPAPPANLLVVGVAGFATAVLARLDIKTNGELTCQAGGDIPPDGYVGYSGVYWTD
jgi:hypothetical protein